DHSAACCPLQVFLEGSRLLCCHQDSGKLRWQGTHSLDKLDARITLTMCGGSSTCGERADVQHLFNLKTTLKCVTFSPDGRLLAVGGYRGVVQVWDAVVGKQVRRLTGLGSHGLVERLFFTAGGAGLACGEYSGIMTWDLTQETPTGKHYPAA